MKKTKKNKTNSTYTKVAKRIYKTENGTYRTRIKNNGVMYSKTFKTLKEAKSHINSLVY